MSTAEILRADLKAAGIASNDGDGRVLDFHSLRQTFITNLSLANVSPQMAKTLARHSDINLTMNTYTHIGMGDQGRAVESLPSIGIETQRLAPQLAPAPVSGRQKQAQTDSTKALPEELVSDRTSDRNSGNNQISHMKDTVPKVGLEPTRPLGTMDFESIASAIPPLRQLRF